MRKDHKRIRKVDSPMTVGILRMHTETEREGDDDNNEMRREKALLSSHYLASVLIQLSSAHHFVSILLEKFSLGKLDNDADEKVFG